MDPRMGILNWDLPELGEILLEEIVPLLILGKIIAESKKEPDL